MAGPPLPEDHPVPRWIDDGPTTRDRWRTLVTNRRDLLHTAR
nr:hypothetical protein [Streptomyces polyasparticus]